jgi:hypothetical protein
MSDISYLRGGMKNYLGQSLGLSALVMAFLLILSAVSKETTLGGFTLRKMDILSDIRPEEAQEIIDSSAFFVDTLPEVVLVDTSAADPDLPRPEVDSMYFGQVIEDYTFNDKGMQPFFAAVDSIRIKGKKVRVAFFGDSFIEGDILLGDLRDTLQSVWGGAGVGYVPITSEIARFRRSFLQQVQSGWRTYSIVNNEGNTAQLGLNGHVYFPSPNASVHYEGTSQYAFHHTAAWSDVRLFYRATDGLRFVWQVEGSIPHEASLSATRKSISVWEYNEPGIRGFAARFPQAEGLTLYGASLESGPGIYFDNFSTRGNSGGKLCLIKPEMIQAFDEYQQYDLIVLQFGLNAVTNSLNNIKWYQAELDKTYKHIREAFPNTPVLIISVPDRGGKVRGELATMISVPYIVEMQRGLARKHGFMFYDFYHGMGGYNSMVRLSAASHPTLVNKDYTHLTHEGGRMIGLQMGALLLKEQQQFINKQIQ